MTEPATPMPLDRAWAINTAMIRVNLWTMGLVDSQPDLSILAGVSLADMLAAKAAVEAKDAAAKAAAAGGGCTITAVCDDRLIAATYTLLHYETSRFPIVAGDGKAVAVLPLQARAGAREDDAA